MATLLRSNTYKKIFSENRGTPFSGLHTPMETVLLSMAMLVEKGSIKFAQHTLLHLLFQVDKKGGDTTQL